jgi:hypothetical protein
MTSKPKAITATVEDDIIGKLVGEGEAVERLHPAHAGSSI